MDQPTDPESITHGDEVIGEPMQTQASRCWYIRFVETIKEFGFSQKWMNHVFTRRLVGVQLFSLCCM